MLKKGDLVLIIGIIILSIFVTIFFKFYYNNDGEKIAVIKQNNKVIKSINLSKVKGSEEIKLTGSYTNVILIEKGRIRFIEADCPDKVCVKKGWLSKNGQMSACIPNRALIEIKGQNSKVDGVAY
jgi:hypothetical protein